MRYAELECKTNFSFLRGASHAEELVRQARELGLSALAITDFDGVYAIPRAYWENKKQAGLKLICGASLSLPNKQRISLLAKDRAGYGLLCRLLTASHGTSTPPPGEASKQAEGGSLEKKKGQAEISWERLAAELSAAPGGAGLVALAGTGADFSRLRPLFSDLYTTLHRLLDGHDESRTEQALWLSRRWQAPLVATNDVHYHCPSRQRLQDALTSIREGQSLPELGHLLFPNAERHLKNPAAMHKLFADLPGSIEQGLAIAESCSFCPSELKYRYPTEWIPEHHNSQSYLQELVVAGVKKRYGHTAPADVLRQIAHELDLISRKEYADYFLTIHDIMEFARSRQILCQGRGSAANSVVCYVLGITAVDPLRINLLFERFLSMERNEPPDIDVDFEHDRREEVLQYVYEKYGRHRAAMVSAVVTYRPRSAFRELAKALGVEVGTLSAKKLERVFAERAGNSAATNPKALVAELAEEMNGFPRHLSIHSGGFTLSADPLIEIVPVEPARMEGRTIIQWDKADLDYLGLLKVDLLSLGMLSALRRTLDLVKIQLHEIPQEDPATYEMIQRADTVGTFQIESRAQMSMLGRLKPATFYDLVIEVAIVRPGPIVGKMVHPYLRQRRRRGQEKVEYPHPKLKEILGKTLGVPLFQEQVMKMAIELGGFSPGEADELRRAIGAWRSSGSIEKMGRRLVEGFRRSGLSAEFAERVFLQVQGFAQYGFPESHAASFALLAYASCYLKRHHHGEFTCGLLNSLPMGFYAAHSLVDDAKRHGVKVLPLHPNRSVWDSTMEGPALRLGWRTVQGLGQAQGEALVAGAPFTGLHDFFRRTNLRAEVLTRLALGDAFAAFGLTPRAALWELLQFHAPHSRQGDLFATPSAEPGASPAHRFRPLSEFEQVREQYDAFALSAHAHPMTALRKLYPLKALHTGAARERPNGARVTVAGLILVRQRPPTAKGMTFSTLEDEHGLLDIAITPELWEKEKLRRDFLEHCFLEVSGKLQKEGHSASLLVSSLRPILPSEGGRGLHVEPSQYFW